MTDANEKNETAPTTAAERDLSAFGQSVPFFRFTQFVMRIVSKLFLRIHVRGQHNMPLTGGVMVVCNHSSHLDPPLIGGWLPRPVRFLAKEELFSVPVLNFLITKLGAFPIRRGASDRAAIRMSVEILRSGGVLLMFPEGTRTVDGSLGEAQTGVAMMLAQAPETIVLPCRLDGTFEAWGPGKKFPRPHRVRFVVGKPFSVAEKLAEKKAKKQLYHELGSEIMARIAAVDP